MKPALKTRVYAIKNQSDQKEPTKAQFPLPGRSLRVTRFAEKEHCWQTWEHYELTTETTKVAEKNGT